jgi:hypothetical protein
MTEGISWLTQDMGLPCPILQWGKQWNGSARSPRVMAVFTLHAGMFRRWHSIQAPIELSTSLKKRITFSDHAMAGLAFHPCLQVVLVAEVHPLGYFVNMHPKNSLIWTSRTRLTLESLACPCQPIGGMSCTSQWREGSSFRPGLAQYGSTRT